MTLEEIKEKKAALRAELEELTTLESDLLLKVAGVQRGDIVVQSGGSLAVVLGADGDKVGFGDIMLKNHQPQLGTCGWTRLVNVVRDHFTRVGQATLTHDNQLMGLGLYKHFSCADHYEDSCCCASDPE